jgi:lipopolysaccharide biosynthesis regulator YciM
MEQAVSAYWWIIIPLAIAFVALIFSLERRGGKIKNVLPENYIAGLKALIDNDDNTAFVKLKQAVADDTDNVDAYLKLGDLFRKRGQLEKAIRVHRELILRKSIAPQAVAQVRKSLAEDYITTKKYDLALDVLEKLAKESEHRLWANQRMLDVYERSNQWEKAFNICKILSKSKADQQKLSVYKYLIGMDLFNEGEFHKARLSFKDALHFDEGYADNYIMIAESYLAEDRKRDAVDFYKKLAEKAPSEFYRVVDKIEEAMFELGHFSDVEAIYRKILSENPDELNILKSLARIEEKKNNIQGAIEYLEQAFSAHPGDVAVAAKLMELYLGDGHKHKAYELLKTIRLKSDFSPYQYICPHCHEKSSKPQTICANCKRVGPYNKL